MALPEERRVEVGGLEIAYREAGSGVPLVFLHGMGGGSAAWEAQYAAFADRYRVIGWDGPGYGSSDELAPDRPVVADYAAALAGFLDALGVDEAHLAGHSFGGILIAAYHRRHPERVASLAFLQAVTGYAARGLSPERRAELDRARHAEVESHTREEFARLRAENALAPGAPEALIRRAAQVSYMTRPRGYLQQWAAMLEADIFDELAAGVGVPCLFVAGGADGVAQGDGCRRIAAAIPGIQFVEFPKAGHVIYMEAAEELNACLDAFLASADN